ncbi:hypothetical protein [Enterococcus termitis]|uniref:Uncharacterized protein n=1 Tax=Enterococcus termitis TaxID=332950 RepID=A0A1E5GJS4_9ENTE|nr:hypothetical protein [Enterococcus termitis]OEG12490.1 hypothetical protein BCR25_08105 [Enterococcus termitis]OJG96704.1 hypothetical protein RV18_GL001990 [Enterococcus termitis]
MLITISIEATSASEYKHALQTLSEGLDDTRQVQIAEPSKVAVFKESEKATESKPEVFTKNSYFYHAESDSYVMYKKGEEIPQDADFPICTPISKKEYDAGIKQQKEVAKKSENTTESEASTDSTSDTETSLTGDEDVENSVSATDGKFPDATKDDVIKMMQEAQKAGKLSAVKTALGRFNADKISGLKEEHYSAFMTDLKNLMEG